MASDVMEIIPKRSFHVLVSNFRYIPIHFAKNTIVGLPMPALVALVSPTALVQDDESEARGGASNPINLESQQDTTDTGVWKTEVRIGKEYQSEREKIIDLLEPFADMWDGHLGEISKAKHRICLEENAKPIFQVPYRVGQKWRELEKAEVNKQLGVGVIEPSSAEWAGPVVFAPKKEGTLRFCVDYRRLNAMTVRDTYPIPRIDVCIVSLGDAVVFKLLYASSGYWHCEVDKCNRDKTTFSSHMGLFRYVRMPFGLKNAPATFQRALDIILSQVKRQFALVYQDDVTIYSRSVQEHS